MTRHRGGPRRHAAHREDHSGARLSRPDSASRWTRRARATSWPSPALRSPKISDTLCDPRHVEAAAAAHRRRADDQHDVRGQHLAVRRSRGQVRHEPPDPRAPASAKRFTTSRCVSSRPEIRTSSSSTAAANCTSACCSRTCGAKATKSPSRGRASSSSRSTASRTSHTRQLTVDVEATSAGRRHDGARQRGAQSAGHAAGRQAAACASTT